MNVMIASHDDIVIRRVPVVIADSGAGPKRVAVLLSNTSGGYYPVLLDNQSQLSILHHTLLTNIFTTQHSNSGKRYCWSFGSAASQGKACTLQYRVLCNVLPNDEYFVLC